MNHDSGIPIWRTLAGANKYGKRINVVVCRLQPKQQ